MFKKIQRKFLVFITFAGFFCAPNSAFAIQPRNLTVLAEPNMVSALTRISRIYSRKNTAVVSVVFDSSAELINNIELGEPSDVFISAHRFWIENLKQKGLVDIYNIGHIANDLLVLVTSKDNIRVPSELLREDINFVQALESLDRYSLNLILDNEGSSLGQYSKQLLRSMHLEKIKVYEKLYEDKTSLAGLVKNNPDSYAILLNSQIRNNSDFRVIATLQNQQIFYQALVIAGDNMENAREFLKFLKSKEAQRIFEENGFIVER